MSTVNSKEIKEVSDEMSKSLKNIKNYLEQMSDSSSRLSKYANLLQECNGKYVEGSLLPNYVEHVLNGQIIKDKNFTVSKWNITGVSGIVERCSDMQSKAKLILEGIDELLNDADKLAIVADSVGEYINQIKNSLGKASKSSSLWNLVAISTNDYHVTFKKYNFSDEQIEKIAKLCYQEQGTIVGAAAEASLMANRYEMHGGNTDDSDDAYNYIRNSGWWSHADEYMDSDKKVDKKVISAVKKVLKDGKRTLPGYVDEHDCIPDITTISNDGEVVDKNDRSNYIPNKTKIKNQYQDSNEHYDFVKYPDKNSDPFGSTNKDYRRLVGDKY